MDLYPRGIQLPSSPLALGPGELLQPSGPFYLPGDLPVSPGMAPGIMPALPGQLRSLTQVPDAPQPMALPPTLSSGADLRQVNHRPSNPHLEALQPVSRSSGRLPPVAATAGYYPSGSSLGEDGAKAIVVRSMGPDGLPDARLYGGAAAAAESVSVPSLKEQLANVPSVYVPDTVPGAEQAVVHDVWI